MLFGMFEHYLVNYFDTIPNHSIMLAIVYLIACFEWYGNIILLCLICGGLFNAICVCCMIACGLELQK